MREKTRNHNATVYSAEVEQRGHWNTGRETVISDIRHHHRLHRRSGSRSDVEESGLRSSVAGRLLVAGHRVTQTLKALKKNVVKLLHEGMPPQIDRALDTIQEKTSLKRQHIAVAALAVLLALFVAHPRAQLLSDSLGFVYPAYRCVKMLRGDTVHEAGPEWLCYWMVGVIYGAYQFLDVLLGKAGPGEWGSLTLHWLVKTLVLAYCFLPQTRGALRLYVKLVRPMMGAA